MLMFGRHSGLVVLLFLLGLTCSGACDSASFRRLQQQQQQDGNNNETTGVPVSEQDDDAIINSTTTTTMPSPSPSLCVVDPDSTVAELLVDLKMVAYQARGRLRIVDNCHFVLNRFELVVGPRDTLTKLQWYSALSLEVADVENKTFLAEFGSGGYYNATTDFVGETTFEFTVDTAATLGYDLQSVGALLLVASEVATPQPETETDTNNNTLLVASALIQKLIPGPAADLLAPQPTMFDNCWTVGDDVRIRWTIDDTTQTIDWGLEYVAIDPANTWMAIGPAFPGLENRLMGGSDVILGGFRLQDEGNGGGGTDVPFADDFYIGGYEVCIRLADGTLDGVCRDSTWTGQEQDNDAELLYAQSMDSVTFLRVRRPLMATTPKYDHDITPGLPQNLIWARGPLSQGQGMDDIQFHGYRNGELKDIDLNETIWDCGPLSGLDFGQDGFEEPQDFDPSTDTFAKKFEQRVMLLGDHMEVFWTLLPETSQIHLGARANARTSSQWMSIAVGESMTDSWAWVASFADEEPQLLIYRISGLDSSTVRMTSEQEQSVMMVEGTALVQRDGGQLSFETIAQWPLPGMVDGSTAAPIIYAVGPSWHSQSSSPKSQDEHYIRSAAPTTIDFSTGASRLGDEPQSNLLLIHGIFMWLAWLVLAPLTAIASRYFRDDPCVPAGSTPSWIQLHKYGALTVISLSLVGLILAIVAAQDTGLGHFVSAHSKIGLALVIMIAIQNFFGILRPPADNPPVPLSLSLEALTKRRIWGWSHRTFAVSMLTMGIAAVITGSQRLEGFDTRTRNGVALSCVWIAMVALLIIFYEQRKREIAKAKGQNDAAFKAAKEQVIDGAEEALHPDIKSEPVGSSPWVSTRLRIYVLQAAVGLGALVTVAAIAFSETKMESMAATSDSAEVGSSSSSTNPPEVAAPKGCSAYPASHLGDGWCDDFEPFNTEACSWDGDDCCNTTSPIYNCKDPSSPNFGASSPRGWGGIIPRNPRYTVDREESWESFVTTYNNYYEFGTSKAISDEANLHADYLEASGWFIDISGLVENPITLNVEAFIGQVHLEERMYRHRCVEAWSITSPWIGFPLTKLLDLVRPLPEAGIVRFVSWTDTKHSTTQVTTQYPWPYTEALTIAEARNELTMLTVGNFQKPLTPSQGAPIRLSVPWKFGYKSIKSIEQISLMEDDGPESESRRTFWSESGATEYGFWSNINPEVPHRRWSQATERFYVSGFPGSRLDTMRMNGYQDEVDYLYKDTVDDPEIYF